MTIWAIKKPDHPENVQKVFTSLKNGEGRFGWSSVETGDLRKLEERIKAGENLSDEERACWHPFLLRIAPDDYVVYVNVPEWGQCTLAKVTGEYQWRWEDKDFNHRFPVDAASVRTFDRNDKMVRPYLSARLKLRGRKWTIYAETEFSLLLAKLAEGEQPEQMTDAHRLLYLREAVEPHLEEIGIAAHHTHPNVSLESLVKTALERVPGVREVRRMRGRADKGADLEVEIETIPELLQTLVVQVKSYEGAFNDLSAVRDIERTIDDADMGLIVSTATSVSEAVKAAIDGLREDKGKPVAVLYGSQLGAFLLKHTPNLA